MQDVFIRIMSEAVENGSVPDDLFWKNGPSSPQHDIALWFDQINEPENLLIFVCGAPKHFLNLAMVEEAVLVSKC